MSAEASYTGRFAPSPTGPLHLGSLLAALASWMHARRAGGSWLVRIDDIDPPREVDGAAQQQLAALQAFGMPPDAAPLFQSTRAGAYRRALEQLDAAGLLYACRCSRTQLAAWSGIHPARCVAGASDCRSPAWRVRVGDADIAFVDGIQGPVRQQLAREVGDFVVWRSDGLAAYQLAVVVDDADQRISDVVRGADLLASTARQIHLQRLLGLPTPRYLHVPVLVDATGAKLGKSQRAAALDCGDPVTALRLAFAALGQSLHGLPSAGDPSVWLQRALQRFDLAAIPRRAAVAHPQPDSEGTGATQDP